MEIGSFLQKMVRFGDYVLKLSIKALVGKMMESKNGIGKRMTCGLMIWARKQCTSSMSKGGKQMNLTNKMHLPKHHIYKQRSRWLTIKHNYSNLPADVIKPFKKVQGPLHKEGIQDLPNFMRGNTEYLDTPSQSSTNKNNVLHNYA